MWLFIVILLILLLAIILSLISKDDNSSNNTAVTASQDSCAPQPEKILVKITNNCPGDIAIGGTDTSNSFTFGSIPPTSILPSIPGNYFLKSGESTCINLPNNWISGRIFAFYDIDTNTKTINNPYYSYDKVEVTINPPSQVNFNLTAVDYIAIPAQIEAFSNGTSVAKTSYNRSHDEIKQGCPTKVDIYGRCVSSNTYCTDPMFTSPTISQGGQNVPNPNYDPKVTSYCSTFGPNTIDVYGCTGSASQPQICADHNRGVPVGSSDTNPNNYYKTPPFNQYSAYLHGPNNEYQIYTFPYDDYAKQSGFQSVVADQLHITFCPVG